MKSLAMTISICGALVATSACSRSDEPSGDWEKGDTKIAVGDKATGEKGKFSIDAKGFKMAIDLPQFSVDSSDMDFDKVKLYPGSTVTGFAVMADQPDGDRVKVSFKSAADAETVLSWFDKSLTKADLQHSRSGNAIVGMTEDNNMFQLTVAPVGDASTGQLILKDKKAGK